MKLEFVVAHMAHAHRTFPDQSLILEAIKDMHRPNSYS